MPSLASILFCLHNLLPTAALASVAVDEDGDGYDAGADCDDSDAGVNPGAIEYCDALDNDCDGLADEGEPVAVATYPDLDGDGHGDAAGESMACPSPEGYVRSGDDCDDADPGMHPGAEETDCADPTDYNCDGSTGFEDTDADGWFACEDCDDGEAGTYPGADEPCDGLDNDCDGDVDEDGPDVYYLDRDGDGWGDTSASEETCEPGAGQVLVSGDCDDEDIYTSPDGEERCDGLDNDCDGVADDGLDTSMWYTDGDGDGVGDANAPVEDCQQPPGTSETAGDCDDANALVQTGCEDTASGGDTDWIDTGGPADTDPPDDDDGAKEPGCWRATSSTPSGLLGVSLAVLLLRRRGASRC